MTLQNAILTRAARFFALAVMLVLLAAPAGAQTTAPDTTQHLLQFAANNAEFHKHVEQAARDLYKRQNLGCPQISQLARQVPKVLNALTFPPVEPTPDGIQRVFPAPTSGIWSEHIKIVACNKIYQINFLAVARLSTDAPMPLLLATLPGTTRTDPVIQNQAERIGANAITRADGASCSGTPAIKNTRIMGYMASDKMAIVPNDTNNGWFEEWEYEFCQRPMQVQIAFIPGEDGGFDINARLQAENAPETPPKPAP